MRDNRGLSLVELLVALAVGSIVITALGFLLIMGLRMYGRNAAHTEVQNEAQTTMNLIIDTIMESQGICIVNPATGVDTECVLLGDLLVEESGSSYDVYFRGNAIVTDINNIGADGEAIRRMYLVSFPNDDYGSDAAMPGYAKLLNNVSKSAASEAEEKGAVALDAWALVRDYTLGLGEDDKTIWLLARYITGCQIEVDRYEGADSDYYVETEYYWNGSSESHYYYEDPITLNITIDLEYDYGSGQVTRTLEDSAAVRSRLDKVYVGKGAVMYEYGLKK